ncbi:phosphoribosylformylglycinamidine synthase [Tindallia magadiensis]|uniref:Phosphoribosylformylglycinamidine synthase n=1 Tax=Tindallia magadiensis TaxID=69895 RepID=A0A1I3AZD3_9FIRM|nr:phosphoribosylformylglycinamidine synthase [Tindallia magadiensis]SFH55384.1 phosphoribosylformylglycinamidine synthase [Tindallia magadiensis]
MPTNVRRIFVEKKPAFQLEANRLLKDLRESLSISSLNTLRILNRYDIEGISDSDFEKAKGMIFSEPPVDDVYDETPDFNDATTVFATELIPGQYDQRADSAEQCIQLSTKDYRPNVAVAKVYVLYGELSQSEIVSIKNYLINPIESREASLKKPLTLTMDMPSPKPVKVINGFIQFTPKELHSLSEEMGMAMSHEDLLYCQNYFRSEEKRDPSITELKMIDTYWSDHCRHTTFMTEIDHVDFEESPLTNPIKNTYHQYLNNRKKVYGERLEEKYPCLMDLATLSMKALRKEGLLDDLEVSEEINACSIHVPVVVDGNTEEWLVMFKNETHNHPTEIEPFGGAATCLGGAIRDPLSGRSYVYQAMRISGSGDPLSPISDTIPGKLPQKKITQEAANGYSSYGNQIGLATGHVREIYHPGYVAKRMELGAVIAAAPKSHVLRKSPSPGDVIILVGGRTGRDGCGGATGSSKEHDEHSLVNCGAEVQKGNAPTERKIQKLFRNPKVSTLIKKCNDFGAGGVAVAIGELADGLDIDLDQVPKKYEGLDGTELAISESQERMAVVLDPKNVDTFIEESAKENLEATPVAIVTDTRRLTMKWREDTIVNLSRDFLDTNGVKQQVSMKINAPNPDKNPLFSMPVSIHSSLTHEKPEWESAWKANLEDLNVCSQKGLIEKFDNSVGAATTIMPLGGKNQLTPAEGMSAKIPVLHGETSTATIMTAGFNPFVSSWSPYHGGFLAVIESLSRLAAMGGDFSKSRLTLQEYFEKPGNDPERWGKPMAALLGAYAVQSQLSIPAIGGKDSMSGTFKDMDVPPTLVSFAVDVQEAQHIISPEFKDSSKPVMLTRVEYSDTSLPNLDQLQTIYSTIHSMIKSGEIVSAKTVGVGGVAATISQMCFGNDIGFSFYDPIPLSPKELWLADPASFVLEMKDEAAAEKLFHLIPTYHLGQTSTEKTIRIEGTKMDLENLKHSWEKTLEPIFPTKVNSPKNTLSTPSYQPKKRIKPKMTYAKPRAVIPVFPGTNSEYDTALALEKAGGLSESIIIRNLSSSDIEESVERMVQGIQNSQMVIIPGGFSAGDEPDGSGKFINVFFRNPRIQESIHDLLKNRDGLMLGICNGFQALIKLGLVPFGEIRPLEAHSPTLTFNEIGRHVSCMVNTRISSTLTPWFSLMDVGDVHTLPVSHGEGRFIASEKDLSAWIEAGQVTTQYVNDKGHPSMDIPFNPNGSFHAVESLCSPDGRVLGKMAHTERAGIHVAKNIPGNKHQKLFESGVYYYK